MASRIDRLFLVYLNPMRAVSILLFSILINTSSAQVLGLLKYDGGGDWYANPTALDNLSTFYNEATGARTVVMAKEVSVNSLLSSGISFLHATGHGRIVFSKEEAEILRQFVDRGGFVHIDDNYGMKDFALEELAKVFNDATIESISIKHPIFQIPFQMPTGLPKIHEHDGLPQEAVGYFLHGELVAILTYETDLSDGWEDAEVHQDSKEKRSLALKMGANLVHWSLVRNSFP